MLTGVRVDVVDDDTGFLKGIERLLRAHGLDVRTFASAEAFEAEDDASDAECFIVDIHLGGMSGIDLLRRLSITNVPTPVVLLTANSTVTTRRAAMAAGCSAYLEKPVPADVLLGAVRNAVAGQSTPPPGR